MAIYQGTNILKRILTILVTSILTASALAPATALAAGLEIPDLTKACTLTLNVKYNGEPIEDGSLNIVKVADVEWQNDLYRYIYTTAFKDFASHTSDKMTEEALTDGLYKNAINNATLSKQMESYADAKKVKYLATVQISGGKAVFGTDLGMTAGLYLITQSDGQASTGYQTLDPFLITVPGVEKGAYIYDVTAAPKTSLVPEEEPPTPPTPPTPTPPTPTPTPPTPLTPPETPPQTPPGPPSENSVLGARRLIRGVLGANRLPQTGQLWWPVPVLFIAGIALVIAGVGTGKKETQQNKD